MSVTDSLQFTGAVKKVYLDYNSTTPMCPEVINTVHNTMQSCWANPSSKYEGGQEARNLINQARTDVARMISASPTDILFTSGGTEVSF